jgi:hypothetical protein
MLFHAIRVSGRRAALIVAALVLATAAPVAAKHYEAWGTAVLETINTAAGEGCPIESPDGRSLFIASNRPGTLGGNDIWMSTRASEKDAWSEPVNLGEPINSAASDYCPTPLEGNWLLFVSERSGPDTCNAGPGAGDIYLARYNPAHGWGTPVHLGCDADGTGPNFPGGEYGPSLVRTAQGTFLYFSSSGYGADMDIYAARMRTDGSFEQAHRVDELSTVGFADFMPNVSRNGLEIVFNSNRPDAGAQGGQDVYTPIPGEPRSTWGPP